MLSYYEKIPFGQSSALYAKELKMPQFDAPRHFHPEYEIMMVFKSRGKRFVGDNIADYSEGDLVLLGPNLPHYWHKGEGEVYKGGPVHAIVVQFNENFLSPSMLETLEMTSVKNLFERSGRGVRFFRDTFRKASPKVKAILGMKGIDRIIALLEILNILASAESYQALASPGYQPNLNEKENDRMNKVYRYILDNYFEQVSLAEAASLLDMNKTAFCHFFRKRTRKTFSAFVNEMRVSRATKLLIETPKNISEICFECGYKNLSNFNRRFREINKMSPQEYRRHFNAENIRPNDNFVKI